MLGLTWNNFSELNLLTDDLAGLLILGFTGTQWEIIPADIDPFTLGGTAPTSLTEGVINSRERVDFSRYEALSLGAVALATDLLISEGITPNNDEDTERSSRTLSVHRVYRDEVEVSSNYWPLLRLCKDNHAKRVNSTRSQREPQPK